MQLASHLRPPGSVRLAVGVRRSSSVDGSGEWRDVAEGDVGRVIGIRGDGR